MRAIVRDPNVGSGAPIFEGTRILVSDVRRQIEAKVPPHLILRAYPALDSADLANAVKDETDALLSVCDELLGTGAADRAAADEAKRIADEEAEREAEAARGPTLLEYVKAGYHPEHYPPHGYHAKPFTPEEQAEAEKIHADREAARKKAEEDREASKTPAANDANDAGDDDAGDDDAGDDDDDDEDEDDAGDKEPGATPPAKVKRKKKKK